MPSDLGFFILGLIMYREMKYKERKRAREILGKRK
jgi:hypothetical protein